MVDPAVGIYVDGVYLGRAAGGLLDVVDLQQVEVLRGPQGTLYGRNTIGGAIKLESVRPQFENSGKVGATLGNYDRRDLRAMGNFQVGDKTAFRIAGLKRERDGFWDVIPNGDRAGEGRNVGVADLLSVRASMLHEFDDDWSLYITADRTLDRSDSIPDPCRQVLIPMATSTPSSPHQERNVTSRLSAPVVSQRTIRVRNPRAFLLKSQVSLALSTSRRSRPIGS